LEKEAKKEVLEKEMKYNSGQQEIRSARKTPRAAGE
jgi:hypothetical protein